MLMSELLSNIRRDYSLQPLEIDQIGDQPILFLSAWIQEAIEKGSAEPNAMVLSTLGEGGRISSRVVLIKSISLEGLTFFSNYESRKGRELDVHPQAALLFFWPELERQVRLGGSVAKVSKEESDRYYHSRPLESRIAASLSPQSSVIPDYQWLTDRFRVVAENLKNLEDHAHSIDRPDHWGGYRFYPDYLEFWQGGMHRLHHRIVCTRKGDRWEKVRLAP